MVKKRKTDPKYARKLRRRRREQGVCGSCGKNPLFTKWMCQECYSRYQGMQQKKRAENLANGLCVECGQGPLATKVRCERCRERNQNSQKKERDKNRSLGLCTRCGKRKPSENCRTCPSCRRWQRSYLTRIKAKAYAAYGGFVCNCCGETEPAFLSIDHVNSDGCEVRRKTGQGCGPDIYRWLIKHGFPEGYQVLCHNCQWGKRLHGTCPHKTRQSQPFAWIA